MKTLFLYTRKQFLTKATKHCLEFVRTCISIPSFIEEEHDKDSDSYNHKSLFFEAMSLGIDPGTMDRSQMLQAIKLAKGDKNQEGGDARSII